MFLKKFNPSNVDIAQRDSFCVSVGVYKKLFFRPITDNEYL